VHLAYNFIVPTPFYHLNVSKLLLSHHALSAPTRLFLNQYRNAFLLGNTAPDVQTISGQSREATHFFDLPLRKDDPLPWRKMLSIHHELAHLEDLAPAQTAFLAGYLCHLQADWLWVKQIFIPVFGLRRTWESFPYRLYLHNVLRAYLDRQTLPSLGNGVGPQLASAKPARWLPFVADADLSRWRDYLAAQLRPGAEIQTIKVFAARQGIAPESYYALITSETRMEAEVFSHLRRETLETYSGKLLNENVQLLERYLSSW